MTTGYVLINVEPRKERGVYNSLLKINEIVELYPVFGEYTFVAKLTTYNQLRTEDLDDFNKMVLNKIRIVDGVRNIKTLVALKWRQSERV